MAFAHFTQADAAMHGCDVGPVVGLDAGCSLVKIASQNPKARAPFYKSVTAAIQPEELLTVLARHGAKTIGLTGMDSKRFSAVPVPKGLTVIRRGNDNTAFTVEIDMMAQGTLARFRTMGKPVTENIMLVSLGTAVSYTVVTPFGSKKTFPVRNSLGGGTLMGLTRHATTKDNVGVNVPWYLSHLSAPFEHLDAIVDGNGEPGAASNNVLSALGGITRDTTVSTHVSSYAKLVANNAVDRLTMIAMVPGYAWKNTVFVGSPVDEFPVLRHWIADAMASVALPFTMLEKSAYVGAEAAYGMALHAHRRSA